MSATTSLFRLRFKRRWKHIVVIATVATALAVLCQEQDFLEMGDSERGAFDSGLKAFTWVSKPDSERSLLEKVFSFAKKKPQKSKDVVIVSIDDVTFSMIANEKQFKTDYGAWPYSRNIWADLLEELQFLGAKAVVFDMTMEQDNPDKLSDVRLAKEIGENAQPFYLGFSLSPDPLLPVLPAVTAENRLPAKREVLMNEIKVTEDDPFGENAPSEDETVKALSLADVAKTLAFPVVAKDGAEIPKVRSSAEDRLRVPNAKEFKMPIPPILPLLHVGPGFGVVEPEADEDGKMRRTWFVYTDGANTYASLSLAVVADLWGAKEIVLKPGELEVGDKRIKINPRGDAEINYGGTLSDRFHIYPLIKFIYDNRGPKLPTADGKPYQKILDRKDFEGKVVIVGGFGLGTADSKPTPFEPGTPAVVKHAAELDSLLAGRYITEAPYWVSLLLTMFIAFVSAVIILLIRSTALEILWPVALYFGFFLVTGAFLVYGDTHVLSAMPSLAGSLASVLATAINHLFADKQLEETRAMMSRYMEPSLVDQMMATGEQPQLGGENREITAFFSDIRGFSGFSEMWKDDPQQLVRFLNDYLSRVTRVLHHHQGCVDKFIGDAVVCLFGAPFTDKEHARHACEAALAVKEEIGRLREELKTKGMPDVYTRIGLNSGVMLVGNIGSDQMYDYTAMGDAMNLAARLEGANKNYESTIMIGEETYRLAKDFIEVRELDRVRVAGKKHPVTVYELIAMKGKLDDKKKKVVEHYQHALGLYRAAQFTDALASLERALDVDPEDGPSRMLGKRVQKYVEHPPPMPFDGIANLEK